MSDTSCARKRARSSIFIVCESLFPIRPHSKCTLLSRRRRSSTKSVDNKYNPFPVPRFYCSTRCPRQGCCCRVCQVCRRTTLHLHQHGPRDHVYSQHAHPIYDLKDVKHLSHGLRKLVTESVVTCLLLTTRSAQEIRSCTTDTLEIGGVNELFVSVTVDASFTTEQAIPSACSQILWIG